MGDGWDGWDGWDIVKVIEKAIAGYSQGWGNPPPTRVIVGDGLVIVKVIERAGEPAPNAGYSQGDRKGYRWL
jgi:hypothetical protein